MPCSDPIMANHWMMFSFLETKLFQNTFCKPAHFEDSLTDNTNHWSVFGMKWNLGYGVSGCGHIFQSCNNLVFLPEKVDQTEIRSTTLGQTKVIYQSVLTSKLLENRKFQLQLQRISMQFLWFFYLRQLLW